MKKLVMAGFSLVAVVLLVLGSQTNVVGYRTIQITKQNINEKDLVFQSIYDLVNNQDIQKALLRSYRIIFRLQTKSISFAPLTKKQLDVLYHFGLVCSRTMRKTQLYSIVKQNPLPSFLQKEYETAMRNDTKVVTDFQELRLLDCHCSATISSLKTAACLFYGAILLGAWIITAILWKFVNFFYGKGMTNLFNFFYLIYSPFYAVAYACIEIMDAYGCFYGIP